MNYNEDGSPNFDEQINHFLSQGKWHVGGFVVFAAASYFQYTNVQQGGSFLWLCLWFGLMCYNGIKGTRCFEIVRFWREQKAFWNSLEASATKQIEDNKKERENT